MDLSRLSGSAPFFLPHRLSFRPRSRQLLLPARLSLAELVQCLFSACDPVRSEDIYSPLLDFEG